MSNKFSRDFATYRLRLLKQLFLFTFYRITAARSTIDCKVYFSISTDWFVELSTPANSMASNFFNVSSRLVDSQVNAENGMCDDCVIRISKDLCTKYLRCTLRLATERPTAYGVGPSLRLMSN